MAWGEEHAVTDNSARMVRRVQERMAADTLAQVVAAYLEVRTGKNEDRMRQALTIYREARCA
jgi:hypothetical protein